MDRLTLHSYQHITKPRSFHPVISSETTTNSSYAEAVLDHHDQIRPIQDIEVRHSTYLMIVQHPRQDFASLRCPRHAMPCGDHAAGRTWVCSASQVVITSFGDPKMKQKGFSPFSPEVNSSYRTHGRMVRFKLGS